MFAVLTTNQKGAIAEAAIAYEAIKPGIGVFRPVVDERPFHSIDRPAIRVQPQESWRPHLDRPFGSERHATINAPGAIGRRITSSPLN
jgi:hypothetical protein